MVLLSLGVLMSLALPSLARAEGNIALAYPLEGIVVDGDLGDWPAEATRYRLLHVDDGDPLDGPEDFLGYFSVGYSEAENALYVAVDVVDDAVVRRGRGGAYWNRHDGCELYIFGHKPGANAPTQYRKWGDDVGLYGPGSMQEVQVEARWRADGVSYEWRVDLDQASGGRVRLGPGTMLGFDVSVWDRDRDGSASWIAWSRGKDKYIRTDRLGRLALLEPGADVHTVLSRLGDLETGRLTPPGRAGSSSNYQVFFSGVLMAVTFFHLLLFLFNRSTRANLFYALYTAAIGAAIFSGLQLEFHTYMDPALVRVTKKAILLLLGLLGLTFLYVFFRRVPQRFYGELVVVFVPVVLGVGYYLARADGVPVPTGLTLSRIALELANWLVFFEMAMALASGVRRQCEGAWIIGGSFLLFAVNISPLVYETEVEVGSLYWVLIPLVSMSVYMARSVGRTHQELQERLRQVEELSAKTQEQYEQIQQQNEQIQEANRLKSDFLARMSHDLRTPMNAIIGYTRILLRRTKGAIDERQYRNLQNVQLAANNLLELINDILDLSKIEADRVELKIESVDLVDLAGACAASVESLLKPGVALRLRLDDVPEVRTDADRVRRALMNLLSNAAKFTEAGHIELGLQRQGGWTEIRVQDTGIGIPAADLPHIFDEFRQVDAPNGARHEGTGLGLAIVKKSAEMLGGTVSVESQEGIGSTFTLRLKDATVVPRDTIAERSL